MKRCKTDYPGIFYREARRIGGNGLERVYYIVFKQGGKVFEEKVGRQYADDMTVARQHGSGGSASKESGSPAKRFARLLRKSGQLTVYGRSTSDPSQNQQGS